jgi:hypothetical protein
MVRADTAIVGASGLLFCIDAVWSRVITALDPLLIGRFAIPDYAFENTVLRAGLYAVNRSSSLTISTDTFLLQTGHMLMSLLRLEINIVILKHLH